MNPQELLQHVQNASRWMTGTIGESTSTEIYSVVEVESSYNGNPIKLVFTDHSSVNPAYRYNLEIVDPESGETVATGNGGADWGEALSIVHWQELDLYYSNKG